MRSFFQGLGGAIAGGLVMLVILDLVDWPALRVSGPYLLLLLAAVPAAYLATIAVHEGGHLVAGALAGFTPTLLIVGPVRLERTGDGWRVAVNRSFPLYGGLAGAAPRGTAHLRQRMTALVAGGPAASLLAGAAAMTVLIARPADSRLSDGYAVAFLLIFGFGLVSLLIGVSALVPGHGHGFSSDGARLLRFMTRDPAVDGEVALLALIGASVGGERPREWASEMVDTALTLPANTAYGTGARVIAHLHALDRHDLAAARSHLAEAVAHRDRLPAMSRPALFLQAAFFVAAYEGDRLGARRFLREADGDLVASPYARQLAEAAILVAEGDAAAADVLHAAAALLPRALDRGAARMAADQIAQLERAVERLATHAKIGSEMPDPVSLNDVTMFPALRYDDAPAAIEWLVRAFGLERRGVHPGPDNTIVHAELGFGGSVLMLGSARDNEFPLKTARQLGGASASIYMYVPDPDAHFAQAKAAGAEIVYEPRDTGYGAREYAARDLEGYLWSFGTYRPHPGSV